MFNSLDAVENRVCLIQIENIYNPQNTIKSTTVDLNSTGDFLGAFTANMSCYYVNQYKYLFKLFVKLSWIRVTSNMHSRKFTVRDKR